MAHMSECCTLPLGATSSRWTRSLCTAEYLTITVLSLMLWSGSPAGGHTTLLKMYVVLGFLLSIEIYFQHLYTSILVWVSLNGRLNERKHLCDSSFLHQFSYSFCVWRRVPGKRCDFFSMHFCVDRLTVLALWQSSINVSRCALKTRWAGMPRAAFPVFLNLTCACYTFVHHSCNWQRAGGNFNGGRVACANMRVLLAAPWRSHDSQCLQNTSKSYEQIVMKCS